MEWAFDPCQACLIRPCDEDCACYWGPKRKEEEVKEEDK